MESECGQAIHNKSQAIDHATECCSVGNVSAFTKAREHLAADIHLGYEVESGDPAFTYIKPPDDDIEWLAAWLISEGWTHKRLEKTSGS